jgi:protein ImuA
MAVQASESAVLSAWRWQTPQPAWSSGFAPLDAWLPDGGWPTGGIIELLSDASGCGELMLLLPALRLHAQRPGWLHWINPPLLPYAPALADAGVPLERLLEIRASTHKDQLWAIEQALQSPQCHSVFAWLDAVDPRWLRRLQLAAKAQLPWLVLLRPTRWQRERSVALLRLRVEPAPEGLWVEMIKGRQRGRGQRLLLPLWDDSN